MPPLAVSHSRHGSVARDRRGALAVRRLHRAGGDERLPHRRPLQPGLVEQLAPEVVDVAVDGRDLLAQWLARHALDLGGDALLRLRQRGERRRGGRLGSGRLDARDRRRPGVGRGGFRRRSASSWSMCCCRSSRSPASASVTHCGPGHDQTTVNDPRPMHPSIAGPNPHEPHLYPLNPSLARQRSTEFDR